MSAWLSSAPPRRRRQGTPAAAGSPAGRAPAGPGSSVRPARGRRGPGPPRSCPGSASAARPPGRSCPAHSPGDTTTIRPRRRARHGWWQKNRARLSALSATGPVTAGERPIRSRASKPTLPGTSSTSNTRPVTRMMLASGTVPPPPAHLGRVAGRLDLPGGGERMGTGRRAADPVTGAGAATAARLAPGDQRGHPVTAGIRAPRDRTRAHRPAQFRELGRGVRPSARVGARRRHGAAIRQPSAAPLLFRPLLPPMMPGVRRACRRPR